MVSCRPSQKKIVYSDEHMDRWPPMSFHDLVETYLVTMARISSGNQTWNFSTSFKVRGFQPRGHIGHRLTPKKNWPYQTWRTSFSRGHLQTLAGAHLCDPSKSSSRGIIMEALIEEIIIVFVLPFIIVLLLLLSVYYQDHQDDWHECYYHYYGYQ